MPHITTWLVETERNGRFIYITETSDQGRAIRRADYLTKLGQNTRVLKIVNGQRPV